MHYFFLSFPAPVPASAPPARPARRRCGRGCRRLPTHWACGWAAPRRLPAAPSAWNRIPSSGGIGSLRCEWLPVAALVACRAGSRHGVAWRGVAWRGVGVQSVWKGTAEVAARGVAFVVLPGAACAARHQPSGHRLPLLGPPMGYPAPPRPAPRADARSCKGCRVDFLATHLYSCNPTWLLAYLKQCRWMGFACGYGACPRCLLLPAACGRAALQAESQADFTCILNQLGCQGAARQPRMLPRIVEGRRLQRCLHPPPPTLPVCALLSCAGSMACPSG